MATERTYETGPKKRTSMNIDVGLVRQAKAILGTANTTDTVHQALEEVVRREALTSLASRDWDMTLDELFEVRKGRSFPGE